MIQRSSLVACCATSSAVNVLDMARGDPGRLGGDLLRVDGSLVASRGRKGGKRREREKGKEEEEEEKRWLHDAATASPPRHLEILQQKQETFYLLLSLRRTQTREMEFPARLATQAISSTLHSRRARFASVGCWKPTLNRENFCGVCSASCQDLLGADGRPLGREGFLSASGSHLLYLCWSHLPPVPADVIMPLACACGATGERRSFCLASISEMLDFTNCLFGGIWAIATSVSTRRSTDACHGRC